METFAERLAQLMRERGWTQLEAARRLGISQALVSHYLSGKHCPLPRTIEHIAKRLGISADELMGVSNAKQRKKASKSAIASEAEAYNATPHAPYDHAMADLRKRWNKNPKERESIRHLISVLFPDDADAIIVWLQKQ